MASLNPLGAVRSATFNMISHLAESELSANKILEELKTAGLGVNRQTGLALIRQFREVRAVSDAVSDFNPFPPENIEELPFSPMNLTDNYHTRIAYSGRDPFTKKLKTGFISVTSDESISDLDALKRAAAYLDATDGNYGVVDPRLKIDIRERANPNLDEFSDIQE